MKIQQLFMATLLLLSSASIYADCSENDYFPWAELPEEATKYEGKESLLESENDSDVPSDWIDI